MKYFWITLTLLLALNTTLFAKIDSLRSKDITCELPKNETLIIGCTNYCGKFNRWALRRYAKKLGYKIKVVELRENKSINANEVDGILIPGGSDINPNRYKHLVSTEMKQHIEKYEHLTELTEIGRIRDEFEFDLVQKYFSNQEQKYQPILGICRGMQVLTASQGIPLYQDIKAELGIKNRRYTLDKIYVQNPESLIQEVVGKSRFRGVELHHQGLNVGYYNENKDKWPHLEVTALSNKNLIAEALEFYNRPVMGVQFHPEFTFGSVRRGIFKWLLKRSCFNHQHKNEFKKGKKL